MHFVRFVSSVELYDVHHDDATSEITQASEKMEPQWDTVLTMYILDTFGTFTTCLEQAHGCSWRVTVYHILTRPMLAIFILANGLCARFVFVYIRAVGIFAFACGLNEEASNYVVSLACF
jgi:hypothetical protein